MRAVPAMRVLFVCLGNICRSPAAEGVLRHLVRARGLERDIEIDSAGTGAWHVGEPPDARMTRAAKRRGYRLEHAGRQVSARDFETFDHVIAMDASNLAALRQRCPEVHQHKLRLYRALDPHGRGEDVPDPYYGGDAGFEEVLDIVERCGEALLAELTAPSAKASERSGP